MTNLIIDSLAFICLAAGAGGITFAVLKFIEATSKSDDELLRLAAKPNKTAGDGYTAIGLSVVYATRILAGAACFVFVLWMMITFWGVIDNKLFGG